MGLNSLVKDLCRARPKSQDIANTVWGLGKLAEAGICPELSGDAREGLNSLVKDLCRARPESQAYCKHCLCSCIIKDIYSRFNTKTA